LDSSIEGTEAKPQLPHLPLLLELAHPQAIDSQGAQALDLQVFEQDLVHFDEELAILMGLGDGQVIWQRKLNAATLYLTTM